MSKMTKKEFDVYFQKNWEDVKKNIMHRIDLSATELGICCIMRA